MVQHHYITYNINQPYSISYSSLFSNETGYEVDNSGLIFPAGPRIFLFATTYRIAVDTG